MKKLELKENELYQEIDLIADGVKIGVAEVDLKGKSLTRLTIDTAFQDRGYGQQFAEMLIEKYGCDNLWVMADNERAIHVYEKLGFKTAKPTMYEMTRTEAIADNHFRDATKMIEQQDKQEYCSGFCSRCGRPVIKKKEEAFWWPYGTTDDHLCISCDACGGLAEV